MRHRAALPLPLMTTSYSCAAKRPEIFGAYHDQLIAQVDDVLLEIEGNISSVSIMPLACKA